MPAIRLLTFDLDDTLWDLRPVLLRAEQLTFDWLTTHAPALGAMFTAEQLRAARMQFAHDHPALRHRVSELRIQAQIAALRQSGYSASEAEQLSQQAFEVFLRARHDVTFFDSALTVLAELHAQYLLAAITNGNASPTRLGLDRWFAFTINAETLAHPKPHATPFLEALQRAQCEPAQAIHIGDHIDHDIRGALAAGMHAIWVNPNGETWPGADAPSASVRHLAELPDVVRAIGEKLAN